MAQALITSKFNIKYVLSFSRVSPLNGERIQKLQFLSVALVAMNVAPLSYNISLCWF